MDKAEYGIVISRDVMVSMRDGVRLATDLHRPARDGEPLPGPFPAILLRTSYDKTSQRYFDEIPSYFTQRGYVCVLQDVRGRYRSEGTGQYFHTANPHEGRDGYDTVEWIAAQPWCSGRIGTVGSSHPAITQTHLALYRPPHLAAIWPDVGPTNSYAHQARMGGAMQLHMFGALFLHAQDSQEIRDDPQARQAVVEGMERMREWVFQTPFKPGHTPLAAVPNLEKTLFDYYTRGAYDEYWSAEFNDFERHFDRHADVPGTFSGGWYDPFAVATTAHYAAMARQNRSPQRLIMGPWSHMGVRAGISYAGDVEFGAEAAWGLGRYNRDRLRWFERWLKEQANGVEEEPPVRIFVMGGGGGRRTPQGRLFHGGRWREEREWPLARTRPTRLYLRADGGLSAEAPEEAEAAASYTYDPARPVPTLGGSVTAFFEMVRFGEKLDPFWEQYLPPWVRMRCIVTEGPMHQQEAPGVVAAQPPYLPLASRPDVLVFQTPPLEEPVEVTGSIEVELWVSSSAPDTDFTVKLIDVYPRSEDYPGGYHLNLTDSILRARYREGWDREVLMEPGTVYPIRLSLPPTSNLFAAGHRIRIDVSSSNFPRFDLNPNTGEPVGRHTHSVRARNTLYFDRERPSSVVLPVIPGGE
jgi:putative CocE/NonD family hydrolase